MSNVSFKVSIEHMELFYEVYSNSMQDILARLVNVIDTCNKISGYWESKCWTEKCGEISENVDCLNSIIDTMTNYNINLANIIENYKSVESINKSIDEILPGDVIN